MYSLDQTQQIEAPIEDVFAFFSDPGNLARITPSWLSFRIQGPAPPALGEGSRIEYRIRWGLFTLRWVTPDHALDADLRVPGHAGEGALPHVARTRIGSRDAAPR